jgi:TatA/E family protein of Tat protein translocase
MAIRPVTGRRKKIDMSLISPVHLLFIAAFALIFLGPGRLPEFARALGAGLREFRDMLNGDIRRRPAEQADTPEAGVARPGLDGAAPAPAGPFA